MTTTLQTHFILCKPPMHTSDKSFEEEVCQEVLQEIKMALIGAKALSVVLNRYLHQRSMISTRLLKQPHVEDYKHALYQLDTAQTLNLRRWLLDLEHLSVISYDLFQKNMVCNVGILQIVVVRSI
eukprot:TRINITY_DN9415_c0_g1_i2.p1 TRINITY_DN9415_c0_g1~~TRINITY_DN9415_c0_g1_i2.p1  ORF type:complete len:125 (+),score=4.03 TRINITY_DN9415_c0_g1_i2:335-709(+)